MSTWLARWVRFHKHRCFFVLICFVLHSSRSAFVIVICAGFTNKQTKKKFVEIEPLLIFLGCFYLPLFPQLRSFFCLLHTFTECSCAIADTMHLLLVPINRWMMCLKPTHHLLSLAISMHCSQHPRNQWHCQLNGNIPTHQMCVLFFQLRFPCNIVLCPSNPESSRIFLSPRILVGIEIEQH
jgi:hypothetical protein